MRVVKNNMRIIVQNSAVQRNSDFFLQTYKIVLNDFVKINHFTVCVVDYFRFARLFAKEHGCTSAKRLTIEFVLRN
jgi:hypothetical protein